MTNGRTANNRGRKAENDVAAWLQANGFPDAERSASKIVDRGDIAGVPGVCVQVKHCNDPMRALRDGQAGALAQAHGRRAVAVVRLPGVTDPGEWWAATPVLWLVDHGDAMRLGNPNPRPGYDLPVDATCGSRRRPRPSRSTRWHVLDRCNAHTIHRAIDEHGGAIRGGWWITTVDRLFAALPQAVASMSLKPPEMVTWSDPDGDLVAGEFTFVEGTEWFEDDDEPVRLRRQRWVCVEDEVGTYWPKSIQLCDACTGETEIEGDSGPVECPVCHGTGEHPLRGAGFVTEERS